MRIILDKNYVYSLSKYIVSSVCTRPKNVRDSKPRDDQKWRSKTTLGNVPLVLEARDKRDRGRGEGRGRKRDLIGENRGW